MFTENENKIGRTLAERWHDNIDFRGIFDREMVRVMQVVGNTWPIRVEVTPLIEEGQPYMHISRHPGTGLEKKVTAVVPVGKVYTQVRSEAKDLSAYWTTVSEILSENSRK